MANMVSLESPLQDDLRRLIRALNEALLSLTPPEYCFHLVLETGDRHPAAGWVYERGGFARRGPVLDYPDSPYSLLHSKSIGAPGASDQ